MTRRQLFKLLLAAPVALLLPKAIKGERKWVLNPERETVSGRPIGTRYFYNDNGEVETTGWNASYNPETGEYVEFHYPG